MEVEWLLHDPAALSSRKNLGIHSTGDRVSPKDGKKVLDKIKYIVPAGIQTPEPPAHSPVAIPTTLGLTLSQRRYVTSVTFNNIPEMKYVVRNRAVKVKRTILQSLHTSHSLSSNVSVNIFTSYDNITRHRTVTVTFIDAK